MEKDNAIDPDNDNRVIRARVRERCLCARDAGAIGLPKGIRAARRVLYQRRKRRHRLADQKYSERISTDESRTMNTGRTMALVRAVYDEVHLALWAALIAFLLYFAVFVAPKLPELRAAAEAARVQQIASENEAYCAKWRMGPGTSMHSDCLSDLGQLRAEIEDQLAQEAEF